MSRSISMFLTDGQIRKLKFYNSKYELKVNTLLLHAAKPYVEGQNDFSKAMKFKGGFIGGLEYPGQRLFGQVKRWISLEVMIKTLI